MAQKSLPVSVLCFAIIALVAVSMIEQVLSFAGSCGGLKHEMFSTENKILKNQSYKQTFVPSYVICGRDCMVDSNCKSFNFNLRNKLCELNSKTRSECPEHFVEAQPGENMYFDSCLVVASQKSSAHKSCKMHAEDGFKSSGIYTIYPEGVTEGLQVYCDMDTDGGGWTVFQRRQDGSVDFHRNWAEYGAGFGHPYGEFWLGNDNLVNLTNDESRGKWQLRVDMQYWDRETLYVKYDSFKITSDEYYTLHITKYNQASSTSFYLDVNDMAKFSTKDRDNDGYQGNIKCSDMKSGGWWFTACGDVFLNGQYGQQPELNKGVTWYEPKRFLKECSMKIREI